MLSSRIRLEGRLETVEKTVAALERGLHAADQLDWAPLLAAVQQQQSPEVREACEHVERLSPQDPAVGKTLARLWSLVRAAEKKVLARQRSLRMYSASLAQGLEQLIDDPLVYRGRRSRRWMVLAPTAALYAGVVAILWNGKLNFWPSSLGFLLILLAQSPKLAAMNVSVTRRRVLLKTAAVPLSDVRLAKLTSRAEERWRRAPPFRLTLQLQSGEELYEDLPEVDPALVDALQAGGVKVETEVDARPARR